METRPKIKMELSPIDKVMEQLAFVLLFVLWGVSLYAFLKLPAIIPIHYNVVEKADNYGNKNTLLILPVIATVIYLTLSYLNKYPHIFNYMVKITTENAARQYSIATRMLRFLNVSILTVFTVLILLIYLTTLGVINGLGAWFLPLVLMLFLVPAAVSLVKAFKVR